MAEADKTRSQVLLDTVFLVQQFHKLFNYTNGPANKDDVKKGIRENVSSKTNHLDVRIDFRKTINHVKFTKSEANARNVKCILGYMYNNVMFAPRYLEPC